MSDIKLSMTIEAPPERVYPLISTGRGFAQWWAADVMETASTDTVELGFFNRTTVYRLTRTRVLPPREAEWLCSTGQEWTGTRLWFQLTPSRSGTLVRFTHADWKDETDYFVSCTTVWGELMFRLKSAAEGRPRGPLFTANGQAY
ncbi:MAG TPA: SRPBCC domain-containing protein [Candidatus Acidoferrales bacterium]|nr:SRPBCC domain-containing protein [Candidatus Acidoferrales bacterium]